MLRSTPGASVSLVVGNYRCEERLGGDQVLETFRARISGLAGFERVFAVKCLIDDGTDPQRAARFLDMAHRAAALKDERIATVVDSGTSDGAAFTVGEFVYGLDLVTFAQRVRVGQQPLPQAEWQRTIAHIGAEAARALAVAHSAQPAMLHGRLVPANILVTPRGRVKVLDFGVRMAVAPPDTQTPHSMYFAPELPAGNPETPEADIYALGAILLEIATGTVAPEGLAMLSDAFRAVLEMMLSTEATARPTAAQAAEALHATLGGTSAADLTRDLSALLWRYSSSQQNGVAGDSELVSTAAIGEPTPSDTPAIDPLAAAPSRRTEQLPIADAAWAIAFPDQPNPAGETRGPMWSPEDAIGGGRRAVAQPVVGIADIPIADSVPAVAFTEAARPEELPEPAVAPEAFAAALEAEAAQIEATGETMMLSSSDLKVLDESTVGAPTVQAVVEQAPPQPSARPSATMNHMAPVIGAATGPRRRRLGAVAVIATVSTLVAGGAGYFAATRLIQKREVAAAPSSSAPRAAGEKQEAAMPVAKAVVEETKAVPQREAKPDKPVWPVAVKEPVKAQQAAAAENATTPAAAGRVVIATNPPGAWVWVDGEERGQAPLTFKARGKVRVTMVHAGYQIAREEIDASQGARLDKTLLPATAPPSGDAGLRVECNTTGRFPILVDGVETGVLCPTSRRISLTPGTHRAGIYLPGEDRLITKDLELGSQVKSIKFAR